MISCRLSIFDRALLFAVSHIKRARYYIQVAAFVMPSLLASSHKVSGEKFKWLKNQWFKKQSGESEVCYNCYIILELMLNR